MLLFCFSDKVVVVVTSCVCIYLAHVAALGYCRYGDLICDMALEAVLKVTVTTGGIKEIDIKRYAKVEKVS